MADFNEVYNPSTDGQSLNKGLTINGKNPSDGKSYYYNRTRFLWRPYKDKAEVLIHLPVSQRLKGQRLYINTNGTLNTTTGLINGGTESWYVLIDDTSNATENSIIPLVNITPAGNDGAIQFKAENTFAGTDDLKWDNVNKQLAIAGNIAAYFNNSFGGQTFLDTNYDGEGRILSYALSTDYETSIELTPENGAISLFTRETGNPELNQPHGVASITLQPQYISLYATGQIDEPTLSMRFDRENVNIGLGGGNQFAAIISIHRDGSIKIPNNNIAVGKVWTALHVDGTGGWQTPTGGGGNGGWNQIARFTDIPAAPANSTTTLKLPSIPTNSILLVFRNFNGGIYYTLSNDNLTVPGSGSDGPDNYVIYYTGPDPVAPNNNNNFTYTFPYNLT